MGEFWFNLSTFPNALPGAIAQGLIWGLMAMGVYISFKILDIADMTVDGSFCTGACVCAVMITDGAPIWQCILTAFIAGALAGSVSGLLNTLFGIPSILAGIITQQMLYTVNMCIMDDNSLTQINRFAHPVLLSQSDNISAIVTAAIFVVSLIVVLWLFFYTEIGLTLKSTGDNPDMSRAQGVNVNRNKVLGLAIANGIVAMAGALYAQYNGRADINDGRGAIVIGLAAIFIGLSVSMKIKPNFVVSLIGVVGGGIVYFTIYTLVMHFGVETVYLKMISATIVILFLAIPYLKGKYFTKLNPLPINSELGAGGSDDA